MREICTSAVYSLAASRLPMVSRFRESLSVALLVLASLAIVHRETIFSGWAVTPGEVGDSLLLNYTAEHEYLWLKRDPLHRELLSPPSFYPIRGTAAYTDMFMAAQLFYAPSRAFGADPQTAMQIWFLGTSALNLLLTYLLLRGVLGLNFWGSAGGALLFAFGSPRLAQVGHPQLYPAFLLIAAYAGLHWALTKKRAWPGLLLLALSAAAQLYTAFYYAWFMAFCGTIAVLYAFCVREYREALLEFLRHRWPAILGATALLVIVSFPAIAAYAAVVHEMGARQYSEVQTFLPNVQAWFAQGPEHPLYGRLDSWVGIGPEYRGHELLNGIGLLTTALVLASWLRFRHRPVLRIWGVTAIAVLVLTLALPGGLSLWKLVYRAYPAADGIRVVSRVVLVLLLPAAIALAAGLEHLAKRSPALAAVCVCVVFAEQVGSLSGAGRYDKRSTQSSMSVIAHQTTPDCDALLASFPSGSASVGIMQVMAMWGGLQANVPALNGYSGQVPPQWPFGDVAIANRLDQARLLRALRLWMESYPAQLRNVCWIDLAGGAALRFTLADLNERTWPAAVAYVDLMGRPAKLADAIGPGDWDGPAFIEGLVRSPQFTQRECLVLEEYRRAQSQNPSYAEWLDGVSKVQSLARAPVSGENKECPSAVLYYCLLHRAPSTAEELENLHSASVRILRSEEFQAQLRVP